MDGWTHSWVILHAFCHLKINFFDKKSFRITIIVSNSLDPDQGGRFVGADLGSSVCKNYQQGTLVGRVKVHVDFF